MLDDNHGRNTSIIVSMGRTAARDQSGIGGKFITHAGEQKARGWAASLPVENVDKISFHSSSADHALATADVMMAGLLPQLHKMRPLTIISLLDDVIFSNDLQRVMDNLRQTPGETEAIQYYLDHFRKYPGTVSTLETARHIALHLDSIIDRARFLPNGACELVINISHGTTIAAFLIELIFQMDFTSQLLVLCQRFFRYCPLLRIHNLGGAFEECEHFEFMVTTDNEGEVNCSFNLRGKEYAIHHSSMMILCGGLP